MASDTDDIEKADGRMIATGWHGYTCKSCKGYHIDLLDKVGNPFASLIIEHDELFIVADKLMSVAEKWLEGQLEDDTVH
jgi:hypothetical protein